MQEKIERLVYYRHDGEMLMRFACPKCNRTTTRAAIMAADLLRCEQCNAVLSALGADVEIEERSDGA